MSEELKALLERVEATEWPSRELDGLIWLACTHPDMKAFHDGVMLRYSRDGKPPFEYVHDEKIGQYTGSIDAALDLLFKMHPDFLSAYHVGYSALGGPWDARIVITTDDDTYEFTAAHEHSAQLALIAAMLSAKIAAPSRGETG